MTSLIVDCAKYAVALAPLMVAIVYWRAAPEDRLLLLKRGVVVLVLGVAFSKIGGAIYHDPRPFVVEHVTPLFPHIADNGFPSDHTLLGFACAFLLLPFSLPLAGASAVVAAAVGAARVAALVHSPVDIAGSFVFAVLANVIAWVAIAAFDRHRHRRHPA